MREVTFLTFNRAERAIRAINGAAAKDPLAELDRELETAQRLAAVAVSENVEAHRALDAYDPDPDPGDTLHERITRVLGPRLRPLTVRESG